MGKGNSNSFSVLFGTVALLWHVPSFVLVNAPFASNLMLTKHKLAKEGPTPCSAWQPTSWMMPSSCIGHVPSQGVPTSDDCLKELN